MTGAAYAPAMPGVVVIDAGIGTDTLPLDQVSSYVARLLTALDRLQIARAGDWRDLSIDIELGSETIAIPAIEALPLAIAILNAARVPQLARTLAKD